MSLSLPLYHANLFTLMFAHLSYPQYQRCSAEGKPLLVTQDKEDGEKYSTKARGVLNARTRAPLWVLRDSDDKIHLVGGICGRGSVSL